MSESSFYTFLFTTNRNELAVKTLFYSRYHASCKQTSVCFLARTAANQCVDMMSLKIHACHWLVTKLGLLGGCGRLLHSPNLEAVALSVGYETWLLIGWHHPFVIGWSRYRLGLPQSYSIVNLGHQLEFPPFFKRHWQSHCKALMAGKCLLIGLCKETMKESSGCAESHPSTESTVIDQSNKGLWFRNWKFVNILFHLIQIINIQSGHNSAHVTTALLLWHVWNCDLIRSFLFQSWAI